MNCGDSKLTQEHLRRHSGNRIYANNTLPRDRGHAARPSLILALRDMWKKRAQTEVTQLSSDTMLALPDDPLEPPATPFASTDLIHPPLIGS